MTNEIATIVARDGVPLFIDVTAQPAGPVLLVVTGRLDVSTGPQLTAALKDAVKRDACVELDLSCVTFVDSTGLSVLINARQALQVGQSLVVIAASSAVRRVFDVTGLADEFGISGRT